MGLFKLVVVKLIASLANIIAIADVNANSMWFFYQPQIPMQLKK